MHTRRAVKIAIQLLLRTSVSGVVVSLLVSDRFILDIFSTFCDRFMVSVLIQR